MLIRRMGKECMVTKMEELDGSDDASAGVKSKSFRKRNNLDTVVSSMMSRRTLIRSCDEDMAIPVFTHSNTGDVLVSCIEVSCKCKQSAHAKLSLLSGDSQVDDSAVQSQLYAAAAAAATATGYPVHRAAAAAFGGKDKRVLAAAGNRRGKCSSSSSSSELFGNNQLKVKTTGVSSCLLATEKEASAAELNALKLFADFFRRRRFELGYTQKDVAAALAEEYRDIEYTQPSIAKFEHLHFSPSRLNQMKMRLEKWLEEAERLHVLKGEEAAAAAVKSDGNGAAAAAAESTGGEVDRPEAVVVVGQTPAALDDSVIDRLRQEFHNNPHPSSDHFSRIANKLAVNVASVRQWFGNNRRPEKQHSLVMDHLDDNNSTENDQGGHD